MGRGVGPVVRVLAFHSNGLSLNPAEDYKESVKCCLEEQKEAWVANFFEKTVG